MRRPLFGNNFVRSFLYGSKNASCLLIAIAVILMCSGIDLIAADSGDLQFFYPDSGKKISMDFKDADLNDVLRIFSHQSGLNFIASTDITNKKITLFLNNVSVEEALERILHANDLTYEMEPGNGIFIVKTLEKTAKDLLTRIYRLKYATTASSKLNKTISISAATGIAGGGGSSGGGGAPATGGSSSGGSGIVSALQLVLSSSGHIVEDARTNSLVITDIPSQFPVIEQTLARLDVPVPQILIEVQMLDVSKDTADKIGVKYGDTPLKFNGAQRDVVYPWDQNHLLQKGFTFASPQYRVGTIDASGLTAMLQFLTTQTDTKNLARPRILTLNNETAEIKISTDEAVGVTTQQSSSGGSSLSSVTAERVQTGIFLTVTPQANLLTGEITLAVAPRVIQARAGTILGSNGQPFKDPEERGSQSILKVYSGDTIMLGGLMRTDYSNTITKLPILGDIPLIGGAFRHKDKDSKERELIIFITPHIITDDGLPKPTSKKYKAALSLPRDTRDVAYPKPSGHPKTDFSSRRNHDTSSRVSPLRQAEIEKALSNVIELPSMKKNSKSSDSIDEANGRFGVGKKKLNKDRGL